MQVFNEINARRLDNQYNIFERFMENNIFLGIIIGTIVVQLLLSNVPGVNTLFRCHDLGLTFSQNIICFGFGILAWPFRVIGCNIPDSIVPIAETEEIKEKEDEEEDDDNKK